MSIENEVCTAPSPSHEGVTHALREARLTKDLSLEQIAASTRISVRYLAAIEAADFSVFRATIYAIGFTKAFARAVGLGEAGIAAEIAELFATAHQPSHA